MAATGILTESRGAGLFQDCALGELVLGQDQNFIDGLRRYGKVAGRETVDGVPSIRISVAAPNQPASKLWFRESDHLLYKVVDSSAVRQTETFRSIRLNGPIPRSAFSIDPPKGAKRVEKL
jgi:hypothetical protein